MKNQREIFEALLAGKTLINPECYGSIEIKFDGRGNINHPGYLAYPENWEIKKNMVKKTKTVWCVLYDDGSANVWNTVTESCKGCEDSALAINEVTFEWEEEEVSVYKAGK